MTARLTGVAAIVLALAAAGFGYWLHNRYRAAIEYKGIGRPYPIGNSVLAFAGMALMLFGIIVAGVVAMVTFV
jgi:uncharacterized membrane protein YidH (DUF202 family)